MSTIKNWKILHDDPNCEINRKGEIREKIAIINGQVLENQAKRVILNSNGYYVIKVRAGDKILTRYVHRLVAETFLKNPDKLPIVRHINGDRTDNRVENLEWVAAASLKKKSGQNHGGSKLTDDDVIEIKKKLANGFSQRRIAEEFDIHYSLVSKIKSGQKWAHIKDDATKTISSRIQST